MNRTLRYCPKFASPFWCIQAFFWHIPAKKVRAPPPPTPRIVFMAKLKAAKAKAAGDDLGLFYAGVRHLYAPAKCLFGVVKTGKGRRKFVYFFSAKNEV